MKRILLWFLFLSLFHSTHSECSIKLSIYINNDFSPEYIKTLINSSSTNNYICWTQITNSEKDLVEAIGSFDTLLTFNTNNWNPIWSEDTKLKIESAIQNNQLKSLMLWDRFSNGDVRFPGLENVVRKLDENGYLESTTTDPPNSGPYGKWTRLRACLSSHGNISQLATNTRSPKILAKIGNQIVSVNYCILGTYVFYSTNPADYYYIRGNSCIDETFYQVIIMIKNAINYFLSGDAICPYFPICPNLKLSTFNAFEITKKFYYFDIREFIENPIEGELNINITSCLSNTNTGTGCNILENGNFALKKKAPTFGTIYFISYTAVNSLGGTCSGIAEICVLPKGVLGECVERTNDNDDQSKK